ncbi:lasso peptide biosynthesis B2 protein [Streptosporangium sp. NPDC048047]|uniref:lasso peptide biosynthesis B2 protein n=1 Tax=Streptosporangium sp. NPDC048047 TaxID=3155748 RepID=UPI003428E783
MAGEPQLEPVRVHHHRRVPFAATAVHRLAAARDWVAGHWPGRAARLENSLATYLALTLRGRHTRWCIGVRFTLAASHAWTTTAPGPLGESTGLDRPLRTTVSVGSPYLTCENEEES